MPKKPYAGQIPFCPITGKFQSWIGGEYTYELLNSVDEATKTGVKDGTAIVLKTDFSVTDRYPEGHNWYSGKVRVRIQWDWRDNTPFEDTMEISGYGRGRSSAVFNLTSKKTGIQFSMFMSDFCEMITSADVKKGGVITGSWRFAKKGANYGLQFIVPK